MQRRKPDAEGKLGPIRADRVTKSKSSCGGELEKQLARRTQLLDQVGQVGVAESGVGMAWLGRCG